MSTLSLTAKYRPQTFADVAGQDTLKSILSRASLEDRVAPAYLFSGTRGVGKTTLARIFAKALNCRNAPAAEPCNACDLCRAVTSGSAVDVIEIDGASNRGIDDIRRLKEVVGYAPMEGRYKIFIIDEAHMLSREAFNALLKTLEEPPAKVTFIMATTEPHKFPATIISRCQHYVFKGLPDAALVSHLSTILNKEGINFEESAVTVIARRGAGSVRDSMSLLGQVLALGDGNLTEASARNVLGLAGQEALMVIAKSLAEGQTLPLTKALSELLDQGLDIGFFLRELAGLWRNLFILKQSGEAGKQTLDLPESQKLALLDIAEYFSLSHIHACWQMTLEGQRRVLTSLEPGLALELLLLNLAMLPELLSLDSLSAMAKRSAPQFTQKGNSTPRESYRPEGSDPVFSSKASSPKTMPDSASMSNSLQGQRPPTQQDRSNTTTDQRQPTTLTQQTQEKKPERVPPPWEDTPGQSKPSHLATGQSQNEKANTTPQNHVLDDETETSFAIDTSFPSEKERDDKARTMDTEGQKKLLIQTPNKEELRPSSQENPFLEPKLSQASPQEVLSTIPKKIHTDQDKHAEINSCESIDSQLQIKNEHRGITSLTHVDWSAIIDWCVENNAPTWFMPLIKNTTAIWREDTLLLQPKDAFAGQRLAEAEAKQILDPAFVALCGEVPEIEMLEPVYKKEDQAVIKEKVYAHPAVKILEDAFEARVIDFGQIKGKA